MIWFVLGVLPFAVLLALGMRYAPVDTLIALALTAVALLAIYAMVYGICQIGWLTGEDCS